MIFFAFFLAFMKKKWKLKQLEEKVKKFTAKTPSLAKNF